MKEKIQITIDNLDDVQSVLRSIELLFQKIIYYYGEHDLHKLNILVLSVSSWFGQILKMLGYTEDDFRGQDES
jgi:hypothetical protein